MLLLGQADDACPDELIRLEAVEGELPAYDGQAPPAPVSPKAMTEDELAESLRAIRSFAVVPSMNWSTSVRQLTTRLHRP